MIRNKERDESILIRKVKIDCCIEGALNQRVEVVARDRFPNGGGMKLH
jgi:hypothetical protein